MSTIGDPNRWWNRKIPILKIVSLSAIIITVLFLWCMCKGIIYTMAWDVHLHRTATFHGQSFQLPWFWREDANYNDFTLTRSRFGLTPRSDVMVSTVSLGPEAVERVLDIDRRAAEREMHIFPKSAGYFGQNVSPDPNFKCFESGFKKPQVVIIRCISVDGYWSAFFSGASADQDDFKTILHGIAAMRTSAK